MEIEKVLKLLKNYIDGHDDYMKIESIKELEKIKTRESVKILIRALKDNNWSIKDRAVSALITNGSIAIDLIKNLKDFDRERKFILSSIQNRPKVN